MINEKITPNLGKGREIFMKGIIESNYLIS
jgi:hypothetical protein